MTVNGTPGKDTIKVAGGTVTRPRRSGEDRARRGPRDKLDDQRAGRERTPIDSIAVPVDRHPDPGQTAAAATTSLLGGPGDDVLIGGDGADDLFAGGGDNVALGGPGDDVLRGEEGDDVLDGGPDDDILIGNAGDYALAQRRGRLRRLISSAAASSPPAPDRAIQGSDAWSAAS